MSLNLATILREGAELYPDKTAIVIGDVSIDYKTLWAQTQLFAGALKELGVERGQHVALMLPNVPQFTIAYFATHLAGGAVVPLNVLFKADEVAYHLEDSDAAVLVVWEGFYEEAVKGFEKIDSCKHLVVAKANPQDSSSPDGALNMVGLIKQAVPIVELPDTSADETAVLLYTSGTTGRPKGAELSQFNMYYNAEYVCQKLLPLDDKTVALTVLPLFHSFGQTVMHNAVFMVGGTVVLLPKFDPTTTLQVMQQQKVTLFAGVPTMYVALLAHPNAADFDLTSLSHCVSGGAAMPVDVMKRFDEKYNVNILEGYGLSETSPVASFNVLDRPKKVGSIGLPLKGVQFRLIDNDGNVVEETGKPGEICIKGHNVMKGYYNRPEANRDTIQEGWFYTGDIGVFDEDGYYFIVDRKKDMIIRGGYNVYPREIEEILYKHPAITEATVIGVADDEMGEEVKAFVVLKNDADVSEKEIVAYTKEHLAAYKYPRIVEFVDELPKGSTGKVLKRLLRES